MTPRQASQQRRSADRAKRRAAKSAPEAEHTDDEGQSEATDAIWEAASAAIVGAAVGAAQALARKREAERAEGAEPEPAEPRDEEDAPHELEEPEAEQPPEEEPEAQVEDSAGESEPPPQPHEAGRPGDAPRMVQQARQQLIELRGVEPESVSGVARTATGWRIGLEVVEVHRIPESTDVLATYEIELDADGELLTFERTHRYYRSEADRR